MRINSGIYDVIFSGTVIGIKGELITFNFPNEYASLTVIFDFVNDKNKESGTEILFPSEKFIKINLYNIQTSLGVGNVELIKLGTLNGREFIINYRINSISDLSRTLNYTFYLGKEVENGK